tara:strand:- start:679 stop:1074 length:396 start_codon:yes stop_codon:yes gene_type:complete
MATLTPTLTLASTDAFANQAISLSITDTLTVGAPMADISTVIATTTGAASIIVPAGTAVTYLYVRHTGTTDGSTATTEVVDIEDTADVAISRLSPGEFAFFPANKAGGSTGIQLQVASGVALCEYMYFTKA